jgi:hypothetical protein
MSWFWWAIAAFGALLNVWHWAGSLALRCIHWFQGVVLRQGGFLVESRIVTMFHWARRELHRLSLAGAAIGLPANALCQQARHEGGWGAEEWFYLGVSLTAWLLVRRWRDSPDCNCDDSHRQRRARRTAASVVSAVGGRLQVVPASTS